MPSTYFVGNVLPPSDDPGENDSTFDFTNEESKNMSLKDVPIRIEHEEGLAVGSVQRDWTDTNGRVIVEPLQIPKEEYDYRLGK